jgi:CRISPR/Cas system CSM-associated protein Csm3 (group 7 of RAMP superfamily)
MANNYNKRYIANIVFEANSPLKVGSSDLDMLQDSPVQKDWNELPMILGTSIAGVLRKEFDKTFANDIFGDEKGSRVIISNALLCDKDMKVIENLLLNKNDFLRIFDNLPIRDHAKITAKGVADSENNGKFDEEVVYKGTRFKFRLELIADENDEKNWMQLIQSINSKVFRLGGGTTKGFGDIKILSDLSSYDIFEITSKEYREKIASLNTTFSKLFPKEAKDIDYTIYTLKIKPDDFFMFGSGFGDDDADMTPVFEKVVDYKNSKLSEKQVLIPASSIKGALAHRTTYYYNLQNKLFIGNSDAKETIKEIFGEAKNSKQNIDGSKGKLLISDCFKSFDEAKQTKTFDHVSIDRFTGGAIDGALFQEKTVAGDKDSYIIEILLENSIEKIYIDAFENALKDIVTGMLPLGGATTKGHGVFCGELKRNSEVIKKGNCDDL